MALFPAYGGIGGGGGGGPALEHGQCRLIKSGANLLLERHNGNSIIIDGTVEEIPAAGVTLAATGLTPDTDHFIYAFMSGATMTLEASTTGHAADAATGVEIKSGDSTRTLVGMARPITGPAWADTAAQRFVISWFNRRTINAFKSHAAAVTTTSTTEIEISSANYRAEFLTWADEMPFILITSNLRQDTAAQWAAGRAFLDTTNVAGESLREANAINDFIGFSSCGAPITVTEGFHFSTLQGRVEGGQATYSEFHNSTLIRG